MVTVHRERGMRVVIFTDDHVPAHVHVFGSGEAKIDLQGPNDAPELVWVVGMTRTEVRKAMQIVTENRESLIARWRSIHG
jgi:hypothetical protein